MSILHIVIIRCVGSLLLLLVIAAASKCCCCGVTAFHAAQRISTTTSHHRRLVLGLPHITPLSPASLSIRGGALTSSDASETKSDAPFELPPITADFTHGRDAPLNGSRGEVVGSTGRVGSLLLRSGNGLLAAVPRGLCPGSLSPPGTPIFVAVHASAVPDVVRTTIPGRVRDLVFVTNGLPSTIFAAAAEEDGNSNDLTVSVPHFGVLSVGGEVVTSPTSPPSIAYGRRGPALASLLSPWGIAVQQVDTRSEIEAAAVKKLMWSGLMWLLCHEDDDDDGPINVAAVHEKKEDKLRSLIRELLTSANALAGDNIGSVDDILQYFESYSLSMPNAIPSKDLAIDELPERNGIFLRADELATRTQPLHEALLSRVVGADSIAHCKSSKAESGATKTANLRVMPHVACSSMSFIAQDTGKKTKTAVNSAIVVGGGMIGCSLALALAKRGIEVTVLDRRNIGEGDIGEATTASWAWLNANDKSPLGYFALNSIGMSVWRSDPVLQKLPTWCGALVRRTSGRSDPGRGGAYCCIGPLERRQVVDLEQNAEFLGDRGSEEMCFFADEGHVDPSETVFTLRETASKLGAKFRGNSCVADTIESEGAVCGVILDDGSSFEADTVIVAAGVGASSSALGALDMVCQPGVVAIAKPADGEQDLLDRILVDTINESHVLLRNDRELAIGGGYLQVGGVARSSNLGEKVNRDAGKELMEVAAQVAPSVIDGATLSCTNQGDRPIPRDGYPAVGFIRPGMYAIVTHSGVTLGPLLGDLAATEICSHGDTCIDLLEPYRPSRFDVSYGS